MITKDELIKTETTKGITSYIYGDTVYTYNKFTKKINCSIKQKELITNIPFDPRTQEPTDAIIEHLQLLINQNTIEKKPVVDSLTDLLDYNNVEYTFDSIYDFLSKEGVEEQEIFKLMRKLNIQERFITSINEFKIYNKIF